MKIYNAKQQFPPLIVIILASLLVGLCVYIIFASIFLLDVTINEAAYVVLGDCVAIAFFVCILVRILTLFPTKVVVSENQIEFHGYLRCVVSTTISDLIINEHSYKDNDWYIDMKIGWRRVCISHTDFPIELKNYIQNHKN